MWFAVCAVNVWLRGRFLVGRRCILISGWCIPCGNDTTIYNINCLLLVKNRADDRGKYGIRRSDCGGACALAGMAPSEESKPILIGPQVNFGGDPIQTMK